MVKKKTNELTVRQVAERTGAAISTMTLYCREGRFPHAYQLETPRGPVWLIPESDLQGFIPSQVGRPKKPPASKPDNGQPVRKNGGKK